MTMSTIKTLIRHALVLPLLAVVLIVACSRATPENYSRVASGMARDQVYDILGKPDEVSGGGIGALTVSTETWHGHDTTIKITFAGDKVRVKSIDHGDA